jgi:hypothetical protein
MKEEHCVGYACVCVCVCVCVVGRGTRTLRKISEDKPHLLVECTVSSLQLTLDKSAVKLLLLLLPFY